MGIYATWPFLRIFLKGGPSGKLAMGHPVPALHRVEMFLQRLEAPPYKLPTFIEVSHDEVMPWKEKRIRVHEKDRES